VLPFIQVVAPTTLLRSLTLLIAAVVLKSVLFAIFEKRIPRSLAATFMFLGNVVTSIIGFFAAGMIGMPGTWLIAVPIVFVLSWFPARRVASVSKRWSAAGVAALLTTALVVSVILFSAGQAVIAANHLALYWTI